jgi:endonuclease III-like uncharacterized protein
MELEAEVNKLISYIEGLKSSGEFQIRKKGPLSNDPADKHIGAIIVDATLSSPRHNYEKQVEKRVKNIRSGYPQAASTSGFLKVIKSVGLTKLLMGWEKNSTEKLKQIQVHATAQFFAKEGIETFSNLATWIKKEDNRRKLKKSLWGIGDKTADYYGVLVCDPEAVAIDERICIFLDNAGIDSSKYSYKQKRTIVQLAAKRMSYRPLDLEQSIWHSNPKRKQKGDEVNQNSGDSGPDGIAIVEAVNYPTDGAAEPRREITITKTWTARLTCKNCGPLDLSVVARKYGATRSSRGKKQVLLIPVRLSVGTKSYSATLHYHLKGQYSWIGSPLNSGAITVSDVLATEGFVTNELIHLKAMGNEIRVVKVK